MTISNVSSRQRVTGVAAALLVAAIVPLTLTGLPWGVANRPGPSPRPDLEYLEAINRAGPPHDPQLLFLLMAQYSSARLQGQGVEFLSARLAEFAPRLTNVQRALYLSAIGLLRAQHAPDVPLIHRIGWVRHTIAMLQQAKDLSGGQVFIVNWIAGVVHAQLPGFLHQSQAARDELTWCVQHASDAPHAGWMREVYYQMARFARSEGDAAAAQDYLRRSGYPDFDSKAITLTAPFSEDAQKGHRFTSRRVAEILPARVYALSGFEFTDYYFVVSDDGRELIGIDAGTRPDAAREAWEALQAYAPGLPKLTTILVTHSHWDHIGGHKYFREFQPTPRFYARSNYREELARESNAPATFSRRFFGERFNLEDVRDFRPDVTIDGRTQLNIGGTRVELIPVNGGETSDALFIELPELGVLFAGDFIMPYLGAPFVEEGNLQGLLDAIDIVVSRHPRYLLHGHEPLTRLFASTTMLAHLRPCLAWLRGQVLGAIQRGEERAVIQRANLIPPGLVGGDPDVQLPYLVMREHVIDRLYDQNVGYWQADLQDLEPISRSDRAELLADYLEISERQLGRALERLLEDGRYDLAASLLESSGGRYARSERIAKAERLTYLRLMEEHQNTDPFKFIIYSTNIREWIASMDAGGATR